MADHGTEERRPIPGTWVHSDRFVPRAFVQPTLSFLRLEAASGILMLVAAVLALVWANSPAQDSYFNLFETRINFAVESPADLGAGSAVAVGDEVVTDTGHADESEGAAAATEGEHAGEEGHEGIDIGPLSLTHLPHLTVRDWINDALMALFFFVVGLEIKRELVVGELKDPKAAALPAFAALGGMVVPAAIYLAFNAGGEGSGGWGIPMATDIAFAVGVLSMVGKRVPVAAKLFLLALAIVDDLGAILVIAIFYTEQLFFGWLAVAAVGLLVVYGMQRAQIRATGAYIFVGCIVWVAVLESGVHATIAGVALALMTPHRAFFAPEKFSERARRLVDRAHEYIPNDEPLHEQDHHTLERVQSIMGDIRILSRESVPPLTRLELALAPITSFVIVPIFALANAGVAISGDMFGDVLGDDVLVGIFLGLLVGKVVGVVGASWIAVKTGLGRMPRGATWSQMVGVGLLAGIGFTVALFVSALSFEPGSIHGDSAKIGIFAASLVAGLGGYAWLKFLPAGASTGDDDSDSEDQSEAQPANV